MDTDDVTLGISVMANNILPVSTLHNPLGNGWVQYALEDPLLMSTILFHSSIPLGVVYRRPPSKLTLQYGDRATNLMKLRLATGDQSSSDSSIAAVVMLLSNQVTFSSCIS